MATLWESVKEKLGTVVVTAAVGLTTIFSDNIISSIKEKVNIAEKRPAIQEKIAKEVSSLIYDAEMVVDYASKNLTKKNELEFVDNPFNASIEMVRKNEYADQASIERYWGTPTVKCFSQFHEDIKSLEGTLHAFNPEYSLVISGKKKKADLNIMKPLLPPAAEALKKAQKSAKELLNALSDQTHTRARKYTAT